jgi:predicted transcriptional regulator YdeE
MWWILLCLLATLLIYLFSLPASYTVTRSIVIAKPQNEVFAYVRDFSNWTAWSPWSLHEPDHQLTIDRPTELGGLYAWDGKKIGAGQMQHTGIIPNERLDILLTFLRPFKNTAKVVWSFKSTPNDSTEITWDMQSQMPLPMRPFQGFIAKMIGYDFALGLALLRGKLDPASEHPSLTFDGVVERGAQTYATEHFEGTLVDMRGVMKEAYPKLWQSLSQDAMRSDPKPMIAAYHKVKFMKATTVMDMGLAVKHLNAGEAGITLPAGKYFQMTMRGNYDFLPSSWNTIYGQVKMQKLKIDKSRPALEVYQTNPMEAPHSNDWTTLLCVPLK